MVNIMAMKNPEERLRHFNDMLKDNKEIMRTQQSKAQQKPQSVQAVRG
jgi:hypothetical protein